MYGAKGPEIRTTSATLLDRVCIGASLISDQIRKHQHTRRDYADSFESITATSKGYRLKVGIIPRSA